MGPPRSRDHHHAFRDVSRANYDLVDEPDIGVGGEGPAQPPVALEDVDGNDIQSSSRST